DRVAPGEDGESGALVVVEQPLEGRLCEREAQRVLLVDAEKPQLTTRPVVPGGARAQVAASWRRVISSCRSVESKHRLEVEVIDVGADRRPSGQRNRQLARCIGEPPGRGAGERRRSAACLKSGDGGEGVAVARAEAA